MAQRKPPGSEGTKEQQNQTARPGGHTDLSLGNRLKMARLAAKLAAKDVAQKIEISKQSVSYWEADRSEPRLDRLRELAKLYRVRFQWLTSGEGPRQEQASEEDEDSPQTKNKNRQQLLFETLQTIQKAGIAVARISINHDDITIDAITPGERIHKSV